jgi:hypothetical protein
MQIFKPLSSLCRITTKRLSLTPSSLDLRLLPSTQPGENKRRIDKYILEWNKSPWAEQRKDPSVAPIATNAGVFSI